jgi:hypothetical protein
MRSSSIQFAFMFSLISSLLLVPSIGLGQAKHSSTAKPKPVKSKSTTKKTAKLKNRPSHAVHGTSRNVHTASSLTHTALHHTAHHSSAGRTPRSLTWNRHHKYRHWMYEVRMQSRAWGMRAFTSARAGKTFMGYLSHHQFQRYMRHQNNMWVVHYRSMHSHRYGMYRSLPVARRVETTLRRSGFLAWLKWHRTYF